MAFVAQPSHSFNSLSCDGSVIVAVKHLKVSIAGQHRRTTEVIFGHPWATAIDINI